MQILKYYRRLICVLESCGLTGFHVENDTFRISFHQWHKIVVIVGIILVWSMFFICTIIRYIYDKISIYSVYERLLFIFLDVGSKILWTVLLVETYRKRSSQIEIWTKLNQINKILRSEFFCKINYKRELRQHFIHFLSVFMSIAFISVTTATHLIWFRVVKFKYVYLAAAMLLSTTIICIRFCHICFYVRIINARIELLNKITNICINSNVICSIDKLKHIRRIYLFIHAISKLIFEILSFSLIVCFFVDSLTILFSAYFGILYLANHALFSHSILMVLFGGCSFIHIIYLVRICSRTDYEVKIEIKKKNQVQRSFYVSFCL